MSHKNPITTSPSKNRLPSIVWIATALVALGLIAWLFVPGSNEEGARTATLDSTSESAVLEIPFKLTESNNISIEVLLDEKYELSLMFHTGNSEVCLTEEATGKLKDLVFDQQGKANSWGGSAKSSFSNGHRLKIGEHSKDNVTVYEDRLSGPGTDGKFGPDLFSGKIIEINFDRSLLVIHDSMPELNSDYQQFECRQERSSIFISGELTIGDESLSNEFMIHSGFGGTLLLDDQFVAQHNLERLEMISESELRDSLGNVLKVKKALLPRLDIGDASFSDMPIGFFAGAIGRQKMSVLGGDILKRFNVILDLEHDQVYLKPNKLFSSEFGA